MLETKDYIALVSGTNLGVLAAALTLLAIYPAVSVILSEKLAEKGAGGLVMYNRVRNRIFRWLGVCIATALSALILSLLYASEMYFCPSFIPNIYDKTLLATSLFLTIVSLVGVAITGTAIFRVTVAIS